MSFLVQKYWGHRHLRCIVSVISVAQMFFMFYCFHQHMSLSLSSFSLLTLRVWGRPYQTPLNPINPRWGIGHMSGLTSFFESKTEWIASLWTHLIVSSSFPILPGKKNACYPFLDPKNPRLRFQTPGGKEHRTSQIGVRDFCEPSATGPMLSWRFPQVIYKKPMENHHV